MKTTHASPAIALSIALVFATVLVGCDKPPSPTVPSTTTPTPNPGEFTVSGIVFEHTSAGTRPLAGLRLHVHARSSIPDVTSDASGRYEVSGIPTGSFIIVAPSTETEYRAPCPPGTDRLSIDARMDVDVVSAALLISAGQPASMPRTILWVSGVVFEQAAEGRRPVAGAAADLGTVEDFSDASALSATLTDASGRYLLCTAPPGTGTDQTFWVRVRKEGYRRAARSVLMGFSQDNVDIELVRN